MLHLIALSLTIFAASAQAEPCPTYNDALPVAVVDVSEFKFFYYPQHEIKGFSDVVLVEKNGALFDLQRVQYYGDDMADDFSLNNKNLSLNCSYNFDRFVSASYSLPDGTKYTFAGGECRAPGAYLHDLACDAVPGK